jgi:hypothetical protein
MDIQYTYDCRLKQSYVYCMSLGIFLIVFSVDNKHDVQVFLGNYVCIISGSGNIDLSIPFEWRRISDDIQSDYELLINSSKNRNIIVWRHPLSCSTEMHMIYYRKYVFYSIWLYPWSFHAYKSTSNDTKGFCWKDLPSWKCEMLHIIFTTMHKNRKYVFYSIWLYPVLYMTGKLISSW